jgi:hypothetical protein
LTIFNKKVFLALSKAESLLVCRNITGSYCKSYLTFSFSGPTDGIINLTISGNSLGQLCYIKVNNRNILDTRSKIPITINESTHFNFTNENTFAAVQTISAILIGNNSVSLSAEIISSSGTSIIERGFCWGTGLSPNINNTTTQYATFRNFLPGNTGQFKTDVINSVVTSYDNTIWVTYQNNHKQSLGGLNKSL